MTKPLIKLPSVELRETWEALEKAQAELADRNAELADKKAELADRDACLSENASFLIITCLKLRLPSAGRQRVCCT